MNTSYIENKGNGKFSIKPLPVEAQVAPVYGMVSQDINNDGNLDLVLVGNDYGMEPGGGRHDAFTGLCLIGNSAGTFEPLQLSESGVFVNGDAKGLSTVHLADGENVLIASQNQDSLKVFINKRKPANANNWIKVQKDDAFVDIEYKGNKKRRIEFYYGSTFLSQSSRGFQVANDVVKIIITDFKGNKRELAREK
jgi:hypothetical protein